MGLYADEVNYWKRYEDAKDKDFLNLDSNPKLKIMVENLAAKLKANFEVTDGV